MKMSVDISFKNFSVSKSLFTTSNSDCFACNLTNKSNLCARKSSLSILRSLHFNRLTPTGSLEIFLIPIPNSSKPLNRWAVTIQNIQTDLGLQRTSFPTLGLHGDYIFTYSESKQMELEDLDNELFLKEWNKKRRAHIQEIVHSSMLSEQEKDWMEEYVSSQPITDTTCDNEKRYVERVIMPNFFDLRRQSHV